MTREEMLKKLKTVEYELIWPESEWKDIGFTEREIWVNSKGYGYISCDEPTSTWSGDGLSEKNWQIIKSKLENETLTIKDIEGCCLWNLLDDLYYGYEPYDDSDVRDDLRPLLELSEAPCGKLFAMRDFGGVLFFNTEEEFREGYERDWCDYFWDELDDDVLKQWIERLFEQSV